MIKIDDKFLSEVGLAEMPEEQKQAFLKHTQEELEVRVGEKMSDGMTLEQLEEFEGIMNKDREVMIKLLMAMGGDYREDELYKKLLEKHNVTEGTMEILSEFLSVKWIQKNRPDYEEIALSVLESLKQEVKENSGAILNSH
ncbi:hypothetical protein IJG73_01605 [Candidatus Saccharibacteria bacterium]|nr:hypothetical protein [Candidatus Saccharibacteria bacterium]